MKTVTTNIESLSSRFEKEKTYWLSKLSGELSKTHFPYDFAGRDDSGGAVESYEFVVPAELAAKLIGFSNGSDKNLFMILLTVFNILLSKYGGSRDIIVTAPVYRQYVDGELINTVLLIRNAVSGRMNFKQLLSAVKKSVVQANENSNYPVEKLMYLLDIPGSDGNYDLYETAILLDGIHDRDYIQGVRHNTVISFSKKGERLSGVIEYNAGLYSRASVERIAGHFINLGTAVTGNLDAPVEEIDILSAEERRRLLYDFNDTARDLPAGKTIKALFEEQAGKRPDKPAVIFDDPEGGRNRFLTYGELNKRANRWAYLLREKGVAAQTIAAIIAAPSMEMVTGFLAIIKAGGAFLPMDPGTPAARMKHMLDDSGAVVLLNPVGTRQEELKDVFAGEIIRFDTGGMQETDSPNITVASDPCHLLYTIYTSGTTGTSKGVLLSNENLVNYISWFSETAGLKETDNTILTQSLAFDLGYTIFFSSLLKGCRLCLLPKDNYLYPEELIRYMIINRVTYIKLTPSFFSVIVNSAYFSGELSRRLRLVLLGGEAIRVEDVEKAHGICKDLRIMNHYGPTETTIGSVARFIDFDCFEEYKKTPTIGKPIYNTKVYISRFSSNSNLELLPPGVPGELCIAGAGMAAGYLNNPKLTAERFIHDVSDGQGAFLKSRPLDPQKTFDNNHKQKFCSNFFKSLAPGRVAEGMKIYKTGDLCRWQPGGDIEFLGRIDSQVKVRGYRVELGEIEHALSSYEGISETHAAIIERARDRSRSGTAGAGQVCAYIAVDREIGISELRDYLSGKLPEYMIPSYFVQLDRLPLTPNGKLDRKSLPVPEVGKGDEFIPPGSEIEKRVAAVMAGVLHAGYENIGLDSDFFELGGHSLKAVNLITKLQRDLDVKLKLIDIFTNPTVRDLSKILTAASSSVYCPIKPVEKKEYYALSPAQRRIYFLQQLDLRGTTFNVPQLIPLRHRVEPGRVESVFNELLKRHESFRTSFAEVDGEVVQKIDADVTFKIEHLDWIGLEEAVIRERLNGLITCFDLSRSPLLRVYLVVTGKERDILLVDMHHIITDGISRRLLVDDYRALSRGGDCPVLRLQYKDYSEWQNNEGPGQSIKEQEAYWLTVFSRKAPRLDMPLDAEREKPLYEHKGEEIEFSLGAELAKQVNEIVHARGVTLFIFLLAVYDVLLAKYCNREDIVVGTGVTGRTHPDLRNIMGMFINSLALRNYPRGDKRFCDFLTEVKESTLSGFENQDYQFDALVEKLGIPGELNRSPLFDSVFQVQNHWETVEAKAADSGTDRYVIEVRNIKYELTWVVVEYTGDIRFTIQYSRDLYKRETAAKLFERYLEILKIVLADESVKIIDIELAAGLDGSGEAADRKALKMLESFDF